MLAAGFCVGAPPPIARFWIGLGLLVLILLGWRALPVDYRLMRAGNLVSANPRIWAVRAWWWVARSGDPRYKGRSMQNQRAHWYC
jgi:hypothetical protein